MSKGLEAVPLMATLSGVLALDRESRLQEMLEQNLTEPRILG